MPAATPAEAWFSTLRFSGTFSRPDALPTASKVLKGQVFSRGIKEKDANQI